MTAAIYARYSSDMQNDRSIEDQIDLCRKFAAAQGWAITQTYDDRAQSGTTFEARLGLQRLIRDAKAKLFTIVLVEDNNRISRQPSDIFKIRDTLKFHGVMIMQVHGGELTAMGAAISALVSSMQLEDLAHKVRRGQAGNIKAGKHAGGRAYGYARVKGEAGMLQIIESEAQIIRQIYTDYLSGLSPRTIATKLNAALVPAPRGSSWNASTINGSTVRGQGILNNELYVGRLVWNKVAYVKNPETRKRVPRLNDKAARQSEAVPHLAIIDDQTFSAVQATRGKYAGRKVSRQPKMLLSGLMKCHLCNGSLVVKDHKPVTRVECATHRESKSCANNKTYVMPRIEKALIEGLRVHLEDPEILATYVKVYNEERRKLSSDRAKNRGNLESRLRKATAELDRIVLHLSKDIVRVESVAPRIKELETEQDHLRAELLGAAAADVITLHPAAIVRYREQLNNLAAAATDIDVMKAFRDLVHSVKVWPDYTIEVAGKLEALTGTKSFPHGLNLGGSAGGERGS